MALSGILPLCFLSVMVAEPGLLLQAKGRGVGLSENLFKTVEAQETPVFHDTKLLHFVLG